MQPKCVTGTWGSGRGLPWAWERGQADQGESPAEGPHGRGVKREGTAGQLEKPLLTHLPTATCLDPTFPQTHIFLNNIHRHPSVLRAVSLLFSIESEICMGPDRTEPQRVLWSVRNCSLEPGLFWGTVWPARGFRIPYSLLYMTLD